MKKQRIAKTFTIETNPEMMTKIERFMAMIHYNSNWGHTSTFGLPVDGDGGDHINVQEVDDKYRAGVNAIGNVGYPLELALSDGFGAYSIDMDKSFWKARNGKLFRDGKLHREYGKKG